MEKEYRERILSLLSRNDGLSVMEIIIEGKFVPEAKRSVHEMLLHMKRNHEVVLEETKEAGLVYRLSK